MENMKADCSRLAQEVSPVTPLSARKTPGSARSTAP